MKTFETEKHNIPDGATHYLDETYDNFFYWGMRYDGRFKLMDTNSKEWLDVNSETFNLNCKPIPQTKEVEWVNGELLEFMGEPCVFIGMSEGFPVVRYTKDADRALAGVISEVCSVNMISRPKTEAERVERDRMENGKALHSQASKTEVATEFGIFRLWEMEDKETRDHYCQLAERINYRKEG